MFTWKTKCEKKVYHKNSFYLKLRFPVLFLLDFLFISYFLSFHFCLFFFLLVLVFVCVRLFYDGSCLGNLKHSFKLFCFQAHRQMKKFNRSKWRQYFSNSEAKNKRWLQKTNYQLPYFLFSLSLLNTAVKREQKKRAKSDKNRNILYLPDHVVMLHLLHLFFHFRLSLNFKKENDEISLSHFLTFFLLFFFLLSLFFSCFTWLKINERILFSLKLKASHIVFLWKLKR